MLSRVVAQLTGGRGARRPPWQAKCKKWVPLLHCILVFSFLLIFSRFLFLVFFKNFSECFPVISGVSTDESGYNRIINLPRRRHIVLIVNLKMSNKIFASFVCSAL